MVLYGKASKNYLLRGKNLLERLKAWINKVKKEIAVLWLASRDERTPTPALIMSSFIVAYVLSPIDLIPDFIPIIGYLDDVLLVSLGVSLAVKMMPNDLLEEFREKAVEISELPRSYAGAAIVIAVWLVTAVLIVSWLLDK